MDQLNELYREYQCKGEGKEGANKREIAFQHTHVVILLDLSPTLWDFVKLQIPPHFEQYDFKFRFLIEAFKQLMSTLSNQLLTIFVVHDQSERVLTLMRNQQLQLHNVQLACDSTVEFIKSVYRTTRPVKSVNYTLQQVICSTFNQLRYQDNKYEHKKYIIFSDFLSFGYDPFSYFLQKDEDKLHFWDSQGYVLSMNGVYISPIAYNPFSIHACSMDFAFIKQFMRSQNGDLYSIKLKNSKNVSLSVNTTLFRYSRKLYEYTQANILELEQMTQKPYPPYSERNQLCLISQYQTSYHDQLVLMRMREGFRLVHILKDSSGFHACLKQRLNPFMEILYLVLDGRVKILLKPTIFKVFQRTAAAEAGNPKEQKLLQHINTIREQIQSRDILQISILQMRNKTLTLDENFTNMVQLKAFENQRFINRNFGQISLLFVVRNIDLRQYQDRDGEFKLQSIYKYIRDKIKEVANRSIGNCLLYVDEEGQFVIVRVAWHTHSILRLICIYEDQKMVARIQDKVNRAIERDVILSCSLVPFDKSLKNLLIGKGDEAELRVNPEYHHLSMQWEWEKAYIWKLDDMYRILASLRVKSGYVRVPSSGGQYNKFYVQQLTKGSKTIVIVQHLYLDATRIYVKVYTENMIEVGEDGIPLSNQIQNYFEKMQQQEECIIKNLHTHHQMYRRTLKSKFHKTIDYFHRCCFDWKPTDSDVEELNKFQNFAQAELKIYEKFESSQSMLDFSMIHKLSYQQAALDYQLIDDENYQAVNAKLLDAYNGIIKAQGDHPVYKASYPQLNYDLSLKLLGPRKLLMMYVNEKERQVIFELIWLDYIEKNVSVPPFLGTNSQNLIENLVNFVEAEFSTIFAKELHSLCCQKIYLKQIQLAAENCTKIVYGFDLIETYNSVRLLFDPQLKIANNKSIAKAVLNASKVEESPIRPKPVMPKKDFDKNVRVKIWEEVAKQANKQFSDDILSVLRAVPEQDLYCYLKGEDKESVGKLKKADPLLFVRFVCIDQDKEEKFQYFSQALVQNESKPFEIKYKEKVKLLMTCFQGEQKQLSMNLKSDSPMLKPLYPAKESAKQISSAHTDSKPSSQHDNLKKTIDKIIICTDLNLKRFLQITEENMKTTIQQMDKLSLKHSGIVITRNFIGDIRFFVHFCQHITNFNYSQGLFSFIQVDDVFFFKMSSENSSHQFFNNFQFEREKIGEMDHPYVVPFWLYIKFDQNNVFYNCVPPPAAVYIQSFLCDLRQYIYDLVEISYQYMMIEECTNGNDTKKLLLMPHYVLEEEVIQQKDEKTTDETVQQQTIQKPIIQVRRKEPVKKQTQMQQEVKKVPIPWVGSRLINMYYGYKGDLVQKLLKNTILANSYSISSPVTFFGQLEKEKYVLMFQEIKNIQAFMFKYPELNTDEVKQKLEDTSNFVIMNLYSPSKLEKEIQKALDKFEQLILQSQENEIVDSITLQLNKSSKLNKWDFDYICQGSPIQIDIDLNNEIQDLSIFLFLLKQNLEKVFMKYDLVLKESKTKSEVNRDSKSVMLDSIDHSFIFSNQKYVNAKVRLAQIFGKSVAVLFIKVLVDDKPVLCFKARKSSKRISQALNPSIDQTLPSGTKIIKEGSSEQVQETITSKPASRQSVTFLFKYRGSIEKNEKFHQYLQALIQQVEIEYNLEYLLSSLASSKDQISKQVLDQIKESFSNLKNHGLHLHCLRYPFKYDRKVWPSLLRHISEYVQQEFLKRTKLPTLSQYQRLLLLEGDKAVVVEDPDKFTVNGEAKVCYLICDNLASGEQSQEDKQNLIDLAKNQSLKRGKGEELMERSLLVCIFLSDELLECLVYNLNYELVSEINIFLQNTSKWSIARDYVKQKVKFDLSKNESQVTNNQKIQVDIEKVFIETHQIYAPSFIDDLHVITRQSDTIREQDQKRLEMMHGETQKFKFSTLTESIRCLIKSLTPTYRMDYKDLQENLGKFLQVPYFKETESIEKCVDQGKNQLQSVGDQQHEETVSIKLIDEQGKDYLQIEGEKYMEQQRKRLLRILQERFYKYVYKEKAEKDGHEKLWEDLKKEYKEYKKNAERESEGHQEMDSSAGKEMSGQEPESEVDRLRQFIQRFILQMKQPTINLELQRMPDHVEC